MRVDERAPDEVWAAHVQAAARGDILRLPTGEPVVGPWCIRCGILSPQSYDWGGFIEATGGDPERFFDESGRLRQALLLCDDCTWYERHLETMLEEMQHADHSASMLQVSDNLVLFYQDCASGARQLKLEMEAHQQWRQTQFPKREDSPTTWAFWEAVFDWEERYGRLAGGATDDQLAQKLVLSHAHVRAMRQAHGRPRRGR